MSKHLSIDYATSSLFKGEKGVYGILKTPDGSLIFVGLNQKLPIKKLWLQIRGYFFDESTFENQIIFKKGTSRKESWAILTKEDWNPICTSEDADLQLCCIAIIEAAQLPSAYSSDKDVVPICLKAKFDATCKAVTAVQEPEIYKLWVSEGNHMSACRGFETSNSELLERVDSFYV